MTAPHIPHGENEQAPRASRSRGRLGRFARAVAPHNEQDAEGSRKLLHRVTRAQKVIVSLGTLGILFAVAVMGPPLPWPLNLLQQLLESMGFSGDGDGSFVTRAYTLAVVLRWLLVTAGSLLLWLTISWRVARFPLFPLIGFLGAGAAFNVVFSLSPTMTLLGWIVIAALAISYIHYYRKGRFGYTRGTSAAIFSHIALIGFFSAFPFSLIAVLGEATPPNISQDRPTPQPTQQGTDTDLPYYQGEGEFDLRPEPGWRIVEDGLVEVITDATSPADLRALFDDQYGNVHGLVAVNSTTLWQVRIRCASVPDLPATDPVLATGWFVVSGTDGVYTIAELRAWADEYSAAGDHERAEWATEYADTLEQAGLASTDDFVLEISDRTHCDPPPPPPNAVTADTVIAAAERAGLDATNPRDDTDVCHELKCLQRTTTDQFTVIVWPTAEAAEDWLDNLTVEGVLFEPVTTAHLDEDINAGAPPFGNADGQRYLEGLTSAAAFLEQSQ